MKVGNALSILYFFMNCSTSNGRTERISRNDLQQRANESGHRRHLKKSKSHSTDEDPEQKLDSETQTPVSAPPVSPPTQSTPKSKKLDDRHKLGKGKKRKVPKKDTDTRSKSKSKKLDHRYGLDKDKKKGAKKSKNCPSIEEDEPSSSSSVKRSKTLSKGKGNKVSSPVKSPTQSALRSKKLEDRYYLGKGKKTKVHKEDIETDCSDSEDNPPSSVLPPIPQTSPPSPVASPVSTSSPLASSISTSKPAPPPTRVPSIPETQTSTPTSAPQPETAAPTLAPSKSPNAPPIQRPVAPPVPRPVAPPPVPRPVAPPPVSAGGFETTLNLENVADRFKSSFIAAATIWDSVIMGDMSDVVVDASVLNSPNLNCDSSLLPGVIDDIFICATVAPIDGENGILGIAGPSFFRFEDTITATIGFMNFDEADMDLQLELGTLEGLIVSLIHCHTVYLAEKY